MGNGGEDREGSRWRHWRELPVSRNALEEPAGGNRGPGTCEMRKVGIPQGGLEGKAGWERGRGRPLQRDLGAFPAIRSLGTAEGP